MQLAGAQGSGEMALRAPRKKISAQRNSQICTGADSLWRSEIAVSVRDRIHISRHCLTRSRLSETTAIFRGEIASASYHA